MNTRSIDIPMKLTPTIMRLIAIIMTLACVWVYSIYATDLITSLAPWLLLVSLLLLLAFCSLLIRVYVHDLVWPRQAERARKPIRGIRHTLVIWNATGPYAASDLDERLCVERMIYEGCPNTDGMFPAISH